MIWIKKFLNPLNLSDWKSLLIDDLEKFGNDKIWSLPPNGLTKINSLNEFWKEIIDIWSSLSDVSPAAPEQILSQPIWYNNNMKIDKKHIYYKNWFMKGIIYINDLIDETGNFKTLDKIKEEFDINCNFLQYTSLISAIPKNWKLIIKDFGKNLNRIENYVSKLKSIDKTTPFFYSILLNKKATLPIKAHLKWNEYLHEEISLDDWKLIHSLPFSETKDSKLITLQFRIIHRIFYTNVALMKFKIIEHEDCNFCSASKETIMHALWECTHVQTVWNCLINAIKEKYNIDIERNAKYFMLGFYKFYPLKGINMIILLVKKYLSLSRQNKKQPSWELCKVYLKNYRKVDEQCMYTLSPKAAKILQGKWHSIEGILE